MKIPLFLKSVILTIAMLMMAPIALAKVGVFGVMNSTVLERKISLGWLGDISTGSYQTVSRTGFGLSYETQVQGPWHMEVDVIYQPRGYKDSVYEYTWNNIQVPVLARWAGSQVLYAVIGLMFTNASGDITQKTSSSETTKTFQEMKLKQMDTSLTYGIGVIIKKLTLEYRLSGGISDMDDDTTTTNSKDSQIMIGLQF